MPTRRGLRFRPGDLNAFFALVFDNVANLVILATILIGAFGFPRDLVLHQMVPGTAVGVLVGDLVYAWMAQRLARRTGRSDVTAMPLGTNAPSIFGMSFAVLGPAHLATGDPVLAWKIGMAVTVLAGLVKTGLALAGNAVRRGVPRAALLGSIAGAGLALIALLPMLKIAASPVVGFVALGVILVTLVGGVRLPWSLPGAFVSVLIALALHAALSAAGLASPLAAATPHAESGLRLALPLPSLAFLDGLSLAWAYLPIALPFAIMTVVGGIDNTESAAVAGDVYDTRAIVATEGICTVVAGLCGGVVESTPYIGHPAYKKMGAGAGYAIAAGLFVGLGGMLGVLPLLIEWVPAAVVAPILVYIGLEVVAQAFHATPARHGIAVSLAMIPTIAFLASLQIGSVLAAGGASAASLSGEVAETVRALGLLGNGFILTALVWAAGAAWLVDGRFRASALAFVSGAVLSLFGLIHSPLPQGTLFLPWRVGDPIAFHFAAAYAAIGLTVVLASQLRREGEFQATREGL